MSEERTRIGTVTHFFSKISVAGIELTDILKVGDTLAIEGATTNFDQEVESMQVENRAVTQAEAGVIVGIRVKDKVRKGDKVYRVG